MINVRDAFNRAYGPQAAQQLANEKLAYSLDDIAREITIAAQKGAGLSLRLASDIYVTATIDVPSAIPRFHVHGGNVFKFCYDANLSALFNIAQPALFAEFGAEGQGTNTADAFVTTSASHTGLQVRNCFITDTTDLLDPTKQWVQGIVSDTAFNDDSAAPLANIRATSGNIAYYAFSSVLGYFNFTPNLGSGALTLQSCGSIFNTGAYDSSAVGSVVKTVALGCNFATVTTQTGDIYIGPSRSIHNTLLSASAIRYPVSIVTLNSANPTLSVAGHSYIQINLGASCSGNLVLGNGVDGQVLIIYCLNVTAPGALTLPNVPGVNNARLDAAKGALTFSTADQIMLIWNDATADWIELCRAAT